jgi:hypothetical protein
MALEDDSSALMSRRKSFIESIVFEKLPELSAFGKKIGFRVPFDENFDSIRVSQQGEAWLKLGKELLADKLGLFLREDARLTPRLGWSILNLGGFAEEFL